VSTQNFRSTDAYWAEVLTPGMASVGTEDLERASIYWGELLMVYRTRKRLSIATQPDMRLDAGGKRNDHVIGQRLFN
jgi:hypothetical protein